MLVGIYIDGGSRHTVPVVHGEILQKHIVHVAGVGHVRILPDCHIPAGLPYAVEHKVPCSYVLHVAGRAAIRPGIFRRGILPYGEGGPQIVERLASGMVQEYAVLDRHIVKVSCRLFPVAGLDPHDNPPGEIAPDDIVMDMHVIKVGDRRSIVPDLQGDAVVIVPQETVPYLDCIGTDYIYTVTVQYITYGIHPVDQDIIIIVYAIALFDFHP